MENNSSQHNFCTSCGKEVSKQENFCSSCGAKINRTSDAEISTTTISKKKGGGNQIVLVLVFFVVVFFLVKCGTDNASRPKVEEPTKEAVSDGCSANYTLCKDNADLMNNNKLVSGAQFACKEATNKYVRYGEPDWTMFPFSRFASGEDYPKTGIIRIADNSVKISNGFGAMEKSEVSCQYDLNKSKIELLVINGQPVIYDDADASNSK